MFVGLVSLVALIGTAPPQAHVLAFAARTELAGPNVRLGDVADTASLPRALRGPAARLTLTILPRGVGEAPLSTRRLGERALALMPALAPWIHLADGQITVRLSPSLAGAASRQPAPCLEAKTFLPAQSIASADAFIATSCAEPPPSNVFRYVVQTRSVRLRRDLKAGERVGIVPAGDLASVLPGQQLFLAASVGPVRIERAVEAVQPAAAGQSLFVRTDDGSVFSAPGPEIQP
jgi:hypothetical protein